jgi:hypothetical protein
MSTVALTPIGIVEALDEGISVVTFKSLSQAEITRLNADGLARINAKIDEVKSKRISPDTTPDLIAMFLRSDEAEGLGPVDIYPEFGWKLQPDGSYTGHYDPTPADHVDWTDSPIGEWHYSHTQDAIDGKSAATAVGEDLGLAATLLTGGAALGVAGAASAAITLAAATGAATALGSNIDAVKEAISGLGIHFGSSGGNGSASAKGASPVVASASAKGASPVVASNIKMVNDMVAAAKSALPNKGSTSTAIVKVPQKTSVIVGAMPLMTAAGGAAVGFAMLGPVGALVGGAMGAVVGMAAKSKTTSAKAP